MTKKVSLRPRREESLSRDRIIAASIALLDSCGESGLTFRALAERLGTGPGAIYWYISSKNELLTAACDTIISHTMNAPMVGAPPEKTIRALALAIFDAMDAHPWIGSALTQVPGQLPLVRLLEGIGQQVRALAVPDDSEWAVASALLNYILGVSGQNASNSQLARTRGLDRGHFLEAIFHDWSQLDPQDYPFARSVAGQMQAHDDRLDFLAGIDLILRGIDPSRQSSLV